MADPLQHWLNTEFGAAVSQHIKSGLKVFPLHGVKDDLSCTCGNKNCTNIGKHPYANTAPNGFKNATDDIEIAAELFEYRTDLNIAIATGDASGIFVIDVDDKNDGRGTGSLKKLISALGDLPETMILTTGNGYHIIFDYPAGEDLRNSTCSFGDEYPDIDTRGNGGYIAIYPSRHFSGRNYARGDSPNYLADLPAKYLSVLKSGKRKDQKERTVDRFQSSGETSEWSVEDIRSALSYIDPDMDYMDWIFIGMGLHRDGFALDLWDEWSARGSKYKGIGDLDFHWRSFNRSGERSIGTIIERATMQGWKPERTHEPRVASQAAEDFCAPLIEKIKNKKSQKKEKSVEPIRKKEEPPYIPQFSFDALDLPGIIGETIRWITKHAIYEQPELAMLNVIAFAGTVFGRKYASPLDTRTNVYLIGVARTGGGKDHSRKMINYLAMESGLSNWIGGNSIRSDTGMLRGLSNNACQLLQLDEFGLLMQGLSDRSAGYHVKSIGKALMSLYSDSNSVYHHGDYADEKAKPIKIAYPHLCIYGTTTEDSYIPALKRSAIKSGELNRFIVIPSRASPVPKRDMPRKEIEEDIVEWWSQFSPRFGNSVGALMNNASGAPATIAVEWGDCEELQYTLNIEQTKMVHSDDAMRDLWSRLFENTIKIAMIFAISRDPQHPVFLEQDFIYAKSIVTASIAYMSSLAKNSMAETPQESSHMEILAVIKEAGTISRREILRKFRKYKKREMDEIIGTMVEEEVVTIDRVSTSPGRPYVVYNYVSDEK